MLDDDDHVAVSTQLADDLLKLIEPIADKLALDVTHNINYQTTPIPCKMI